MADDISFYKNNEFKEESAAQIIGDISVRRAKRPPHPDYMNETEVKIQDLRMSMESWREVILPINSILNWEKQWHPFSIVGFNTTLFMMLWLMDPSVLTTFSIIGLTLTLSDFFVPYLSASLLHLEPWTDKSEEKYTRICRSLIKCQEKFSLVCRSYYLMRSTRPKLFYGLSSVALLIMAWVGNNIHNLLLSYMVVTFVCLLPGLQRHGILQRYGSVLADRIADMATNAKINVGDTKKEK